MNGFDDAGLRQLASAMTRQADADEVGGVAWLAARGDDVEAGFAGHLTRGEAAPIARDSIFRISSMTKPMLAVAALILVEECTLRLDEPVDSWLPELSDRRVLVDGNGPMDGPTVPARRPITLDDLLTMRLGWGMDFAAPWPQPLVTAMDELDLGGGPPTPQVPPEPAEWMRRVSALPLLYQPGERWLYNTGFDVLGVLVSRAAGRSLPEFMRARIFEPLGMVDTGFHTAHTDRLGTCYRPDPSTGERVVHDTPTGQWSSPPSFPSGAGGLVSTLDDVHAFGRMLLAGGRLTDGSRLVSRASVEAMTSDHIGVGPGVPGPSFDGSQGWGFGVGVQTRRTGLGPTVGSYGWAGGLGTSWGNDPREGVVGVVLTTDAFAGAFPPPAVVQDFWTCVYAALE
jgi:CubicO group peptidase (beta-lactamase class C family)